MLRAFAASAGMGSRGTVRARDRLDEGAEIVLQITIDVTDGSAIFDFTGTSPQLHANLNAPKAVTYSAVIYSLRCLCDTEMPLNQVCE
jgi:5-oxoprolinase (ATP-hydrolysing)